MTALAGVRVLDLSSYLPGPYASMLFADFGADVIQVESPSGDPARNVEPAADGESALHAWVGRNKRSITVDLKTDEGLDSFFNLVSECDVVIEGFTPGVAQRLGVGYEACRAANTDVVYCAVSGGGYGHQGRSEPGHDLNYLARSGFLSQAVDPSGSPVPVGPPVADISAGLHAAFGILAALRHRDAGGGGQFLDVSLIGAALALTAPQIVKAIAPIPLSPAHDHNLGADPAYRVYRTQDSRFIAIGAYEDKYWAKLCEILGRPDLVATRVDDPASTVQVLSNLFGAHRRSHWDELLGSAGVCYSPVNEVAELMSDDLIVSREDFVKANGRIQLRNPIRMGRTPASALRPAPPLGSPISATWRQDFRPQRP